MIRMGFDAVQIARMERCLANPAFAKRVFTAEERALFAQKKRPANTAAAHFAAREALAKAMGCGIFGFRLQEAAVLRGPGGAPYFALGGALAGRLASQGLTAQLSLCHEGEYAFACVLLQPADGAG